MKLKMLSSALSLIVLSTANIASANSLVVGQMVGNPVATVSTGSVKHRIGSQSAAYLEGDTITTEADSNAKVSLTSGLANIVIAPNTVMSVLDASETKFSLTKGAFSVEAKDGQIVSVQTSKGVFELSSKLPVNAVVSYQDGDFAAVSKGDVLNVQSQDGVVTAIESGGAFVFNNDGAASLEVQAAGGDVHEHEKSNGELTSHAHDGGLVDHSHGSGYFNVNNGLIVGGLVVGTALLSGTFSDGSDAELDAASPAE